MAGDQPGAIALFAPEWITFDSTDATWLVIHKTAGFQTAQDCAAYFADVGPQGKNTGRVSAHYVIGLDGTIVQVVLESRGAGANCCLEDGHASFLPTNVNLNLKTISVEHIDPAVDNSTPVTSAQAQASFRLVHDICTRHNISLRAGDASGGVIGHHDIAPLSRARCPGNYPMGELLAFLQAQGGRVMPTLPNEYMEQAAAQEFNLMNRGVPYNRETALVKAWRERFFMNRSLGPALTQEYQSVSWDGKPLVKMLFAWGRAEWDGQVVRLYGVMGEI